MVLIGFTLNRFVNHERADDIEMGESDSGLTLNGLRAGDNSQRRPSSVSHKYLRNLLMLQESTAIAFYQLIWR